MDKKYYSDVQKGSKVFNPNNAFPDFLCVSKMKVIKEDRSISSFLDIYLLTLFEALGLYRVILKISYIKILFLDK